MKTRNEVLEILRNQKSSLLENYQITRLGIFGSYAREQQTPNSDLDILVNYDLPPTLIKLIELSDYLSHIFAIKVDIVTENGLKPRIRERVLSEVIYL
jgi:predicted nucleotidyltransferase